MNVAYQLTTTVQEDNLFIGAGPARARWEVLWVKRGRIIRYDCGTNYPEAMRVYLKALSAGKPGATLRCKNLGFAPPPELAPRTVTKTVVDRGRRRKKEFLYRPMKQKNREGIFWCPYCMKLRRFKRVRVIESEGVRFRDGRRGHLRCPMCGIGLGDHYVSQHNPEASRIHYLEQRVNTKRTSR
jgi:hypothetical protein